MVQESPESAAEKGHSLSPRTPSPSKAGTPRNPEKATLLDKEAGQRGAGNTGQDTLKSATAPSTVSATQAGSYATTKSVGQIALGTALITQNTALLRQLRTAPQGSFDHVLDHLLVASIVINAISIVLAVLLATATEKSKTEKGQAVPGEGTPISGTGESGTAAKLTDDPRAWPGGLDARLQAMHPAGTHFYSAWLTYANLLVTLLGTVVLILNAVITGLAPANTGS